MDNIGRSFGDLAVHASPQIPYASGCSRKRKREADGHGAVAGTKLPPAPDSSSTNEDEESIASMDSTAVNSSLCEEDDPGLKDLAAYGLVEGFVGPREGPSQPCGIIAKESLVWTWLAPLLGLYPAWVTGRSAEESTWRTALGLDHVPYRDQTTRAFLKDAPVPLVLSDSPLSRGSPVFNCDAVKWVISVGRIKHVPRGWKAGYVVVNHREVEGVTDGFERITFLGREEVWKGSESSPRGWQDHKGTRDLMSVSDDLLPGRPAPPQKEDT